MTNSQNLDNEKEFDLITIDHEDEDFKYTIVPNALIRDTSISPQCRWLIIFLISNKPGWVIRTQQLWTHTKGFMGRDAMLRVMKECIESGYMKKDILIKHSSKGKILRGFRYTIAKTPKFKKSLHQPENQVPGFQEPKTISPTHQSAENKPLKDFATPQSVPDNQGPGFQGPGNQGPDFQGALELLSKELLSLRNNNTPPIPPNPAADAEAAIAAEEGVSSSTQRKIKKPTEFSMQVVKVTARMLAILTECNPVYRPPDKMDKFLEQVHTMIEKDKQNVDDILQTFEWACRDNEERDKFKGWQSVVCSNKRKGKVSNPAEIFYGHFSTIYSQMKAQPKRKFAPCSDDAKSLAKLKEWSKGAL